MPNFYETLYVSQDATQSQIKKAYHKLAIKYHPDKHSGDKKMEDMFARINKAKDVLLNERKKHFYDVIHMSSKPAKYKDVHPKGWHYDNVAYAFFTDKNNNMRATLYDFFEQPFHLVLQPNFKPGFVAGLGTFSNGKVDAREPTEDDFGTYEAVKDYLASGRKIGKDENWNRLQYAIGNKKMKKPKNKESGPSPMKSVGRCSIM